MTDEGRLILGEIQKMNLKIDRLEEKTDRLEKKVDGLEEKTDRLEKKVDGLEEKTDRLEKKTDSLERKITEVQVTIENGMMMLRLVTVENEVRRLKEQIEETA